MLKCVNLKKTNQKWLTVCCISYQNMKVIKWMDSFLTKLMQMFPPQNMDYVERVNNRPEEFDSLYLELNRHITDKFTGFIDKKLPVGQIYGPLLYLKTLLAHYKPNADRYFATFEFKKRLKC